MSRHVDFYFDYISPYAYIGWHRAKAFARKHDVEVRPEPVLFAAMLAHHGHKGPAEIPPKRVFTFKDVVRQAKREHLRIQAPASHPFNPLLALRATLVTLGDERTRAVDTLFDAVWARSRDVTQPEVVKQALDDAGLDGGKIVERAQAPATKERFKQKSAEAVALGVFGVPTFVAGNEVLWGSDQLDNVLAVLDGRDVITPEEVDAFLRVQASASRPGS